MEGSFYSKVQSVQELKEFLDTQRPSPTNTLNKMLLKGVTFSELKAFLKKDLTDQFSLNRSGFKGFKNHIRYCEKNGWRFFFDLEYFLKLEDPKKIFQIVSIKRVHDPKIKSEKRKTKKQMKSKYDQRLKKIVSLVSERVRLRVDSIDSVHRFLKTGIEAWFKVEVVAALGEEVISLKNRGPDLTLVDDLLIELKAATDFNPSYLRDGALKDSVACLFLGDGEQNKYIERLKSMPEVRVISIKYIYGQYTWVVGCVVPN